MFLRTRSKHKTESDCICFMKQNSWIHLTAVCWRVKNKNCKNKQHEEHQTYEIHKDAAFREHRGKPSVWRLIPAESYGFSPGFTAECLIHYCFPSFWSQTWKREFCLERKQNGWTHQYVDNIRLFSRCEQEEEAQTPNFITAFYCTNISGRFLEIGLLNSFMWHLRLGYFLFCLRGKMHKITKSFWQMRAKTICRH